MVSGGQMVIGTGTLSFVVLTGIWVEAWALV